MNAERIEQLRGRLERMAESKFANGLVFDKCECADLLAILKDHAALKAEVERVRADLSIEHFALSQLEASYERIKARAETAVAELEKARPLLEAAKKKMLNLKEGEWDSSLPPLPKLPQEERIEKIVEQIYEILWNLVGNSSNYSDILGGEMMTLKQLINKTPALDYRAAKEGE